MFTRANRRQSRAMDRQSAKVAALAALYAGWSNGTLTMCAEMDVVAMNEPDPALLRERRSVRPECCSCAHLVP